MQIAPHIYSTHIEEDPSTDVGAVLRSGWQNGVLQSSHNLTA